MIEALQKKIFNPEHVIKVFYSACTAVRHMHAQRPPITHRDIKVYSGFSVVFIPVVFNFRSKICYLIAKEM